MTAPTPAVEPIQRADEALAYIRGYYDVPAALGQRVIADGQPGTIVWAQDARLMVLIDGAEHPTCWHPTWRMEYVAAVAQAQ